MTNLHLTGEITGTSCQGEEERGAMRVMESEIKMSNVRCEGWISDRGNKR